MRHLASYLESNASHQPNSVAVADSDGAAITYGELNRQADAVAAALAANGIRHGDRVGVVLPKSITGVSAFYGIMKAGAAYVPVDHASPAERGRRILADCQIRGIVTDNAGLEFIPEAPQGERLAVVIVEGSESKPDPALADYIETFDAVVRMDAVPVASQRAAGDLAYVLYTSGSTGMPKGVMLTHENAVSFVEWASSVFQPTSTDRFSSHAPFHFDLSILDLYLAAKHGACVHLISEDLARNPKELAKFIASRKITIWYSTPSILTFLTQFGQLEKHDYSSLRLVLFAGEVFPVKHLRALQQRWRGPLYYNLYGPTETNVCTFAEIPAIDDGRETPYPIGFACAHCAALVLDENFTEVAPGGEGLLYISGPSVFPRYWNRPLESEGAFIERAGLRWYNTGDVVRWNPQEGFTYIARRDRMVKRRGYRVELGEIERALYAHPDIQEVAVVANEDPDKGIAVVAFLSSRGTRTPSLIDLKKFCGSKLPAYMSPDSFVFHESLPRTSTGKVDYQALKGQVPNGISQHQP